MAGLKVGFELHIVVTLNTVDLRIALATANEIHMHLKIYMENLTAILSERVGTLLRIANAET